MYYIAINYGQEGWQLRDFKTIDELHDAIISGKTQGNEFKIFKELRIKIEVKEEV